MTTNTGNSIRLIIWEIPISDAWHHVDRIYKSYSCDSIIRNTANRAYVEITWRGTIADMIERIDDHRK